MNKKRKRTVGAIAGGIGGGLGAMMPNILLPSCTMIVRVIIGGVTGGGIAAIVYLILSSLLKTPKDEEKQ